MGRIRARFCAEVNIELGPHDGRFGFASGVEVVAVQFEFAQFAFEGLGIDAEVDQGADEHIAADAAEDIEVEVGHGGRWKRLAS